MSKGPILFNGKPRGDCAALQQDFIGQIEYEKVLRASIAWVTDSVKTIVKLTQSRDWIE